MLVLSRQKEQTIMIGDLIEITIVDIRGDKVRLGISAPVTVPVHRKEVYEAIQIENRAASKVAVSDVSLLETITRRPAGVNALGGTHAPATVTGPIPTTGTPQSSGA